MKLYTMWYWVLTPERSAMHVQIPHCSGDTVRDLLRQMKYGDLGKYVTSWGFDRVKPDGDGWVRYHRKFVQYGFLPADGVFCGYPATVQNHKGQVYFD